MQDLAINYNTESFTCIIATLDPNYWNTQVLGHISDVCI